MAVALAGVDPQGVRGARLRWAAALYPPPAPQPPGQRGRHPPTGQRPRRLKVWAARAAPPGPEGAGDWSGRPRQPRLVFSRTALWYPPGGVPGARRLVWVRAPAGRLPEAACLCPALQAPPEQLLPGVVRRWAAAVPCEEARAPGGVATPRQGADWASARTTPGLLGLLSLVTWRALRLRPNGGLPGAAPAWDHKPEAPFADCLALVRQPLWRARSLVHSASEAECVQFPREALDLLVSGLRLAT